MQSRPSTQRPDSRSSRLAIVALGLLLGLLGGSSCGSDSNDAPAASFGFAPATRTDAPVDARTQLALAAELLLGERRLYGGPGTSWPSKLGLEDRAELRAIADGVVRHLLLESGAGVEAVASPWLDRVSAQNQLVDRNQNGSTRDEALALVRSRYEFRSNAATPAGIAPAMLFADRIAPQLREQPTSRSDAARLRLRETALPRREFTMGQLASTILASVRAATPMLASGRGDLYGATPEEGMRGLLLLEQAVAVERLAVEALAWDGRRLTSVGDSSRYDAKQNPRAFVGRLAYDVDASGAASFRVVDRGSLLSDQAQLLQAFAELAWLAGRRQSHPRLARLFQGDPFGERPAPRQQSGDEFARPGGAALALPLLEGADANPAETVITWDQHIEGILIAGCSGLGCHDPTTANGVSVKSYNDLLNSVNKNAATNPLIVKGDHQKSLLWQSVALPRPPVSRRMPDGGPWLSQAEIDLIARWIDGGALEKDDSAPDIIPAPGLDGMRVILANLVALHVEPQSGACVDRSGLDVFEDASARGALIFADSTGELLSGLAAVVEVEPGLTEARTLLLQQAQLAVRYLVVNREGRVAESANVLTEQSSGAAAKLEDACALACGLFDAARALGAKEQLDAAKLVASRVLQDYLLGSNELRTFPGGDASRVTPEVLARVFALLRLMDSQGDANAAEVYARIWAAMRARMVLAEWPESGEAFGDGKADSDDDGIPEVGTKGLPPLFAPLMQNDSMRLGRFEVRPRYYSRDVLPMLLLHCSECHAGSAKRGDFRLDGFHELFRGGQWRDQTTSIVPSDAEKSFFYRKSVDRPPSLGGEMPEARPPLSPAAKQLIADWINTGAIKG